MALDPESLYRQVGRMIETMPDLNYHPLSNDAQMWLARADALVNQSGDIRDGSEWRATMATFNYARPQKIEVLRTILYRVLAAAELQAPAGIKGSFIPAGNAFDAYAAVSKVLQTAARDILIVDPYMDESALTDFGQAVRERVMLRLLADEKDYKQALAPAAQRWAVQYAGARPLEVRLAPARALHDRAIFVDGKTAWILTQSLNAFAKRSPAEIVRADDTAARKIAAYEEIWWAAKKVV